MPAVKSKRISTLIETQLPEFITNEYELFAKFVEKYYEAQEVQGGTLDIISNIQKYADIDYYEQNILKQKDTLASSVNSTDTTITVLDASSFPEKNGYVRIENEIIFYASRTDTQLLNCSRGVSGNTSLGDLYEQSNFVSTDAASHIAGSTVYNVSNLFLYAFVKNFENQYLGSFPEKYLKGEVDKRTLIKNIQKFYKSKGTSSSIKFIFNTIVAKDINNKPEVYNPRDFTYKSSNSDWINVYALKCKVVSGNPKDLIGKKVVQIATDEYGYSSAVVDNVYSEGLFDGEEIWNIVLAPETVNGKFAVSTKTRLERPLLDSADVGDRIDVFSTMGWDTLGEVLIGTETIQFSDKSINQFIISKRDAPVEHKSGEFVYKPVRLNSDNVILLTLGVVYNLSTSSSSPYSFTGDSIQVSDPGFQTDDPKIIKTGTNSVRWILNNWQPVSASTNLNVQNALSGVPTNVSAILEDDQYYYITGSSYPSYNILDRSPATDPVQDQKILRILRKNSTITTEIYKTPASEVGILLNGVRVYGYKDDESIRFGKLEEIKINTKGRNYDAPPFVLIDRVPNKARAVLTGSVVDRIIVDTDDIFLTTPQIEITSGEGARARAVVTGGEVTSIIVENPGKFYSSPPRVLIRDRAGRGRFAEYTATIDTDGSVTGFNKISGGTFYTQENIEVEVVSVGSGATANAILKEWVKNRFAKYQSKLDSQFGYLFKNYDNVLDYGYGQLANPKSLRVFLQDNLNNADTEPQVKTHSPILGFAYDGNPIYGPFGYQNPLDSQSQIVRMTSSYSLKGARENGPSTRSYQLGTFIDDYKYIHRSGSLDENNGRFCVTPDFPEGVYAYFITIDSNQVPQFPYIIGDKFYSLPVDSNYNSAITQNDIPKNAKRIFIPGMPRNGEGLIAKIEEVQSGFVDNISIDRTSSNFSVDCKLYFNNSSSEGSDVEVLVESVKGKPVNYLQSKENKVVKLTTIQSAFLFQDDILRQPASGASGQIVGTVTGDNVIVLKNVVGTFNNSGTFSADIKTFQLTIDQDSNYTKGAILSLTDGINPPVATAEILEGTSRQNTVKIKVLSGTWIVDDNYFLQSSNLFNTSGSRIITLVSLSDNLEPFEVNQSVALIETDGNHGLGIGDEINVNIFPDDNIKTKNYYVRKRLYQKVTFRAPKNSSVIDYTGIGRFTILNGGADYTAGIYTNVPLTGGSGTGATASIVVSDEGVVASIQIQNGGKGYKRGDYLGVEDDQIGRSGASLSSSRFTLYVDHVGVSYNSTSMQVKSNKGFSVGDLVSVGSEIVEIIAINDNVLGISRALEGTEARDLFDGQKVSLYKPRYNFSQDYQITNNFGTGYIRDYDLETQRATIVFDYSVDKRTADDLTISTTFFDNSSPSRLVTVASVSDIDYKFEISEDNINFTPNPNINIQEFYKYVFDTSHPSLLGTYFDMSPSKSYNLITLEKTSSNTLPGNTGSFTDVKFGFGSRISQNNYDTKRKTNFLNFYYFDKNGIVNSEGAYLSIVQDPLQGTKIINYVTPDRFVYDIPSEPLWDGSGSISYTTSGKFAIGKINTVKIINSGQNYKKVPLIVGVSPSESYRGSATVLFDNNTKVITSVRIDNLGSNYVNPIAVITDGDGVGARFRVVQRDGKLFSISVENPGRNYTYAPKIEIIESDVEMYAEGSQIGIPRSVRIIDNGGAYHLDKTVSSTITSQYTVSLRNFSGNYQKGETLIQTINGVEVSRSSVSEYRSGSNLLKLEKVRGILRKNVPVIGSISGASGILQSVFVSTFSENITSFFDNLGFYKSDKGKLGVANQKLIDSFFYQDYSYVVKSKTSIEQWRDLIKSTTHPAGFKLFGQVDIETAAKTEMPAAADRKADTFTIIQLWDPEKNKITSDIKQRVVTQTVQKVENTRIKKGQGSAATSEFNFNETRAFEFTLAAPFDGYYDTDGRLQGTTTFQVLDPSGNPFTPISAESLIVTLDGIIQDPGVAYTVSQDKIIFAAPPLGDGVKLTGQTLNATTTYKGVKFLGRAFYFKRNQYNSRYIRKIRNIFQRNGRWIDAANQIERNRQFIIEESIGYGKQYYPFLDWSTKLDDYAIDIGHVLDAYQHDLRFGGNSKVVDYSNIFSTSSEYIIKNKSESLDIFNYATRLAKLSIRNWDYVETNVNYIQGSFKMTLPDTSKVAIGMYVSSGRAYPSGTRVLSINSATEITLSKAALANSGGTSGAAEGITSITGSTGGSNFVPGTNTARVPLGETFSVDPGDTLQTPISFSNSDSATFYLSGINNGTFYDASNLVEKNKAYIQEETLGWAQATFPGIDWNAKGSKCQRDLGYLVDAISYHLRFGGNKKVVEFGQFYYTKGKYPYPELLEFVNEEKIETLAAFNYASGLMVSAMRNQLGAGTYTNITPFIDPSVAADIAFPVCQEVESAINSMISIIEDIFDKGVGAVEIVEQYDNKPGYWSATPTYSNYNLIDDPLLYSQECNDVISSVGSLYEDLQDILNSEVVEKTLPDYIDGETKEFDLFWDNGDPVITEEDERLLLTVNAVLQETKYNASYPGDDSYYIDRTTVPNKLIFDVAPIWDQYEGAKTLGEPTAVEKVSGVGIGNYKRLTIDKNLINNVRTGPFLILDLEDLTVANIEEPDYLLVFIDGVLQKEGFSYTVSGPNIFFNVPITTQMRVDMRYMYGRDVGQILNLYDYNKDQYYAKSDVVLRVTSNLDVFLERSWMGKYNGNQFQLIQTRQDGTHNVIGEVINYYMQGNDLIVKCFGNKSELLDQNIIVLIKENYNVRLELGIDINNSYIQYELDEVGRLLLTGNDQYWRGTNYRKSYRSPFINLSNNSSIRVEGEDSFRKIKELPFTLTSREQRLQEQVSNSYFGSVSIGPYNGITRGEGLSIVAIMEKDGNGDPTGRIERLEWNQRSYDPITQPTAYQYYTPPVIVFIPENGEGGGARANVLVSKGQVISVDLIDPGSGYTEPPKVVVSRRYDIIEDSDIGVSVINVSVNPNPITFTLTSSSIINVFGNQISGINTFTSVFFRSPVDSDRVISAQIQLVEECGQNLSGGLVKPILKIDDQFNRDTLPIETTHAGTEVSSYIQTLAEVLNIYSESRTFTMGAERHITTNVQYVIQNNSLSNVNYYEVAAYLDLDLDPTDTILYVPDTSKFKSNGYLLVGNEVVRYFRKLNDRFLKVQRGENNTTAQFWPAGTYLRQIPDLVSVTYAGVSLVESESQIVTIRSGAEDAITERETEYQIITPDISPVTTTRVIELELQPQINVESISSVEARILYKLEPALKNVQAFKTTHNETLVRNEIQAEIEEFYTFNVSQTIVDVAVRPTITSTSEVIITTDILSLVKTEPVENAFVTSHKETFISKFRDTFSATLGILKFNFEVTDTVLQVAVNPVVESTSYITFVTESISVRPSETVTTIDSIAYNETTVLNTIQSIRTELFIRKDSLELLIIPPPSGAVDGYEESIFLTDPVPTRLGGEVDLTDDYGVVQRDGNIVYVTNLLSGGSSEYIGDYAKTNVGTTIGHFNALFDDGSANVSAMTIEEVSVYYSSLSIKDFTDRANSSYTISGDKFNLVGPSIQNPVTFASSAIDIGGVLNVDSTEYFGNSGYLLVQISSGIYAGTLSVIEYTGKTTTTFTGCTLLRGNGLPSNGDEIVPFTIS